MIINSVNAILDFANSDFVSGLANLSQFYNIYQSTKAGTYAQLNHDMDAQTFIIEKDLEEQTQKILSETLKEIEKTYTQNEIIISQNEELLVLLKQLKGDKI